MKLSDFQDTKRFEPGDEHDDAVLVHHGAPVRYRNYREKATGRAFRVSESSKLYRATEESADEVAAPFGPWLPLG